jgi:hypothetical protein
MRLAVIVTLVAAFAVPSLCVSAPSQRHPARLTGKQFVTGFAGEPGALAGEQSLPFQVKQEIAVAYVAGVADATEGTVWCTRGTKPDEIDSMIYGEMRTISPEKLAGAAHPLMLEILKQKYPCPPKASTP